MSEEIRQVLPNGQEIRGTVQRDGTVLVTDWPAATVTSTHPHGILGAILEGLDPELYRAHFGEPAAPAPRCAHCGQAPTSASGICTACEQMPERSQPPAIAGGSDDASAPTLLEAAQQVLRWFDVRVDHTYTHCLSDEEEALRADLRAAILAAGAAPLAYQRVCYRIPCRVCGHQSPMSWTYETKPGTWLCVLCEQLGAVEPRLLRQERALTPKGKAYLVHEYEIVERPKAVFPWVRACTCREPSCPHRARVERWLRGKYHPDAAPAAAAVDTHITVQR
jgi:hypothetical protein